MANNHDAKEQPRFDLVNQYEGRLKGSYAKMLGEMMGEISVTLTKILKQHESESEPDRRDS